MNASPCPGDTPMEVWRYIEERAVGVLTRLFGTMLQSERTPEEWRRRVLVLIFNNKGDVLSCSNDRDKTDEPYHEAMGKSCCC